MAQPTSQVDFLEEARRLKEAGIARAVEHANIESFAWSDRAIAFIHEYARSHRELTTELVRLYAEAKGMPQPPDSRAWSHPIIKAAKNRWIEKTDKVVRAFDPKVHCNEVRVWRSLIFGG